MSIEEVVWKIRRNPTCQSPRSSTGSFIPVDPPTPLRNSSRQVSFLALVWTAFPTKPQPPNSYLAPPSSDSLGCSLGRSRLRSTEPDRTLPFVENPFSDPLYGFPTLTAFVLFNFDPSFFLTAPPARSCPLDVKIHLVIPRLRPPRGFPFPPSRPDTLGTSEVGFQPASVDSSSWIVRSSTAALALF